MKNLEVYYYYIDELNNNNVLKAVATESSLISITYHTKIKQFPVMGMIGIVFGCLIVIGIIGFFAFKYYKERIKYKNDHMEYIFNIL